ncbi:hypothetical protein PV08_08093 [Exophiala spinifera]|uniref:Uncharacterized protein n=1 Tax=Exophiala spinifera TaxID=91928 RepID=A0A0D1YD74_9EURO|nr:uncharacterized protein PV08_08093 [Exophiala spinifera]KIW12906.1 hypothetical protein PV08_08093 [Exophiala spinifera]
MGKVVVDGGIQGGADLGKSLVERLWGLRVQPGSKEGDLFMEYYNAKIAILDTGKVCPTNGNDIIDLVAVLKSNKDKRLRDLQLPVISDQQKHAWLSNQPEQNVQDALKFAASIWLMFGTSDWSEDETLRDCLSRNLPSSDLAASNPRPADFRVTARSLNQIAGIEIVWSSELKEHLRYDQSQRMLTLFRHASFLKERGHSGYPKGFMQETAATLALLFPYGESPHKRWNRRVRRRAEPDVEIGLVASVSRNPQDYPHWGSHLVAIQQAFETSKPRTLKQWVHDKRDSNQFYTFWFAVIAIVLTLMFGLIQSITGILQVVNS